MMSNSGSISLTHILHFKRRLGQMNDPSINLLNICGSLNLTRVVSKYYFVGHLV